MLVIDPDRRKVHLASFAPSLQRSMAIDAAAAPVAAATMRLNADALDDIVVLARGDLQGTPVGLLAASLTDAGNTYVVNVHFDGDDGTCGVADPNVPFDPNDPLVNCTLREAMNAAAISPGHDSVTFNLLSGSLRIQPTVDLPAVSDPNSPVVIDGTTQPGWDPLRSSSSTGAP
jgi:CSLREA domain-containing protein